MPVSHNHANSLGLKIVIERDDTAVVPPTRLLEATDRQGRFEIRMAVDPYRARANVFAKPMCRT